MAMCVNVIENAQTLLIGFDANKCNCLQIINVCQLIGSSVTDPRV